jgi:hypothetical protein
MVPTHLGNRPVDTGGIEESYPHLAPRLAAPCDFFVYHKALAEHGPPAASWC